MAALAEDEPRSTRSVITNGTTGAASDANEIVAPSSASRRAGVRGYDRAGGAAERMPLKPAERPCADDELGRLPEDDSVGCEPTMHLVAPRIRRDTARARSRDARASTRRCRPGGHGSPEPGMVACRGSSGRSTRPSRRGEGLRPGSIAPPTTSCSACRRRIVAIQSAAGIICAIVRATTSPDARSIPSRQCSGTNWSGAVAKSAHGNRSRSSPGLGSPSRHEHLHPVALRLERLEAGRERLRRRVRPDHDGDRRLAPSTHDSRAASSEPGRRPAVRPRARPPRDRRPPC